MILVFRNQTHLAHVSTCGCVCWQLAHTTPTLADFVQAFFADIYAEARKAKPGLGHKALAQIAGADKLLRHYTMNIDGLAESAGIDTWHVNNNPTGGSATVGSLTSCVKSLLCK